MKVHELETKNGRVFRVITNNDAQERRLFSLMFDGAGRRNDGEELVKISTVLNGIHSIKEFEDYYGSL